MPALARSQAAIPGFRSAAPWACRDASAPIPTHPLAPVAREPLVSASSLTYVRSLLPFPRGQTLRVALSRLGLWFSVPLGVLSVLDAQQLGCFHAKTAELVVRVFMFLEPLDGPLVAAPCLVLLAQLPMGHGQEEAALGWPDEKAGIWRNWD